MGRFEKMPGFQAPVGRFGGSGICMERSQPRVGGKPRRGAAPPRPVSKHGEPIPCLEPFDVALAERLAANLRPPWAERPRAEPTDGLPTGGEPAAARVSHDAPTPEEATPLVALRPVLLVDSAAPSPSSRGEAPVRTTSDDPHPRSPGNAPVEPAVPRQPLVAPENRADLAPLRSQAAAPTVGGSVTAYEGVAPESLRVPKRPLLPALLTALAIAGGLVAIWGGHRTTRLLAPGSAPPAAEDAPPAGLEEGEAPEAETAPTGTPETHAGTAPPPKPRELAREQPSRPSPVRQAPGRTNPAPAPSRQPLGAPSRRPSGAASHEPSSTPSTETGEDDRSASPTAGRPLESISAPEEPKPAPAVPPPPSPAPPPPPPRPAPPSTAPDIVRELPF